MKIFKRVIKILLTLSLMGIVYSFFFTTYEHFKVNKMINDFKSRGDIENAEMIKVYKGGLDYYRRYIEVPRETKNELNDNRNVFYDNDKEQLGMDGDIFVTRKSPFPNVPIIHQFVSYYYGGHAALLNYENDRQYFIEATGFPDWESESLFDYIFNKGYGDHDLTSTVYETSYNSWQTPRSGEHYYNYFYRDKYIGLRAVNLFIDEENSEELYNSYIEESINMAKLKVENEHLYNFLFFLNMKNKYYCTDLIGRVYEEAYEKVFNNNIDYHSKGYAKKMNDDGFITSVNDLILSKDTFIHFYVEINEEKINDETVLVENIYYLEDVR